MVSLPKPLPDSSDDLQVPKENADHVAEIYEILRQSIKLDFRFEDLAAALSANVKNNTLLRDIHIALLQLFIPNAKLFPIVDQITWPETLRRFLMSQGNRQLERLEYRLLPITDRIKILKFLAEQFSICVKNRAENDTELTQDSVTPDESSQTQHVNSSFVSKNKRLGCDSDGREYRFVVGRVFVNTLDGEDVVQTSYYSTFKQFKNLYSNLSDEPVLQSSLRDISSEIKPMMIDTECQTNKMKGKRISYFENLEGKRTERPFKLGNPSEKTNIIEFVKKMYGLSNDCRWANCKLSLKSVDYKNITSSSRCKDVESFLQRALMELDRALSPMEAFMHPNWSKIKRTWMKAIEYCKTPADFTKVLSIFQICIKDVVLVNAWREEAHVNFELEPANELNEIEPANSMVWMWQSHNRAHRDREQFNYRKAQRLAKSSTRNGREPTQIEKKLFEMIHHESICKFSNTIFDAKQKWNQLDDYCKEFKECNIIKNIILKKVSRKTAQPADFSQAKALENIIQSIMTNRPNNECTGCQVNSSEENNLRSTHCDRINETNHKAALKYPLVHSFLMKNGQRSEFVLPTHELRKLARRGGAMKVNGFIQKPTEHSSVLVPTLGTCWQFHTLEAQTYEAVALQLEILAACIRWEEMSSKDFGKDRTIKIKTNEATIIKDVISTQTHGRFCEKTSYKLRTIIVPKKQRKRPRVSTQTEEVISEDKLELNEIKFFLCERQQNEKGPAAAKVSNTPTSAEVCANSNVSPIQLDEPEIVAEGVYSSVQQSKKRKHG